MSTFSLLSAALWAVTISPAVENTLSLGREVAGIPIYILAIAASKGYLKALTRHQSSAEFNSEIVSSCLYEDTSSSTRVANDLASVTLVTKTSPNSSSRVALVTFAGVQLSMSSSLT